MSPPRTNRKSRAVATWLNQRYKILRLVRMNVMEVLSNCVFFRKGLPSANVLFGHFYQTGTRKKPSGLDKCSIWSFKFRESWIRIMHSLMSSHRSVAAALHNQTLRDGENGSTKKKKPRRISVKFNERDKLMHSSGGASFPNPEADPNICGSQRERVCLQTRDGGRGGRVRSALLAETSREILNLASSWHCPVVWGSGGDPSAHIRDIPKILERWDYTF